MTKAESSAESAALNYETIADILGPAVASFISTIAKTADSRGRSLYLVGGFVRDLLLGKANHDIDFVLEDDAIAFARDLARRFGGDVQAYPEFGTATWTLDEAGKDRFSLAQAEHPQHVDFAQARSETYAHPTALPTVSPGDIRQDMWRRDFSINALALQVSPSKAMFKLIDPCGGEKDLRAARIRVLHSRSFIDDPTRILRAMRFAVRLGFEIEAQTEAQLLAALPWLARVTGPRLRNEIDLSLCEPDPGSIIARLSNRGVFVQIHSDFHVGANLPGLLSRGLERKPPWRKDSTDSCALGWCLLLSDAGERAAKAIAERLGMTKTRTRELGATARLANNLDQLADRQIRRSQIVRLLDGVPEISLQACWLLLEDLPAAIDVIANYMLTWRHQRPTITGDDLIAMGLPPGPRYKQILERLRSAWIDGEIASTDEERTLLEGLLTGAM